MTFSTTKLALGAVLTIAAAAAQAQGYVSLSAGASKADFDCTGSLSCDNKGTGFKLLGGYKFNPNVAIEGGYLDFGKATSQFTGAALGLGGGVYDVSIKTNGPAVGVAFHAPLAPSWNIVGRLGLLRAKTKATVSGPLGAADDSESSSQLYGGLAVGYAVTQQVSIEAGWDFSKAKYGGESATLNMFSLGLSVGF